jgi:hypothetical protein
MSGEDRLYRDLQIHLDKQTIGFPATQSGSDIALLKQMSPPQLASIAMMLTYKYESLEQIQARAKIIGESGEEAAWLLDEAAARGVIGCKTSAGAKQYRKIPWKS